MKIYLEERGNNPNKVAVYKDKIAAKLKTTLTSFRKKKMYWRWRSCLRIFKSIWTSMR